MDDIVTLLRTRHNFNEYSLEYYDIEFNRYVLFSEHTFLEPDFANAKCVRMRILNLGLETPASSSSQQLSHGGISDTSRGISSTAPNPAISHGAHSNGSPQTASPIIVVPSSSTMESVFPPSVTQIDSLVTPVRPTKDNNVASSHAGLDHLKSPSQAPIGSTMPPSVDTLDNMNSPRAAILDPRETPSDNESSQSASDLDNLVPGIPIDFMFANLSEPQDFPEDVKPVIQERSPKTGSLRHGRNRTSERYGFTLSLNFCKIWGKIDNGVNSVERKLACSLEN